MNITIIGTGYVGLVTGACLADIGNHVFCLDLDERKIATLNSGGIPIYEPGLAEVVESNVAAKRISFSTDIEAAVAHGDVQFIAVGTPPDEDGSADMQYVLAAARNIGKYMNSFKVIVDKSTVPVGTADRVTAVIQEELDKRGRADLHFSVVSNPEFLKEGAAVDDFMRPDRIVIGYSDDEHGREALRRHRLRRKLLPQGYPGADAHRPRQWPDPARARSRGSRQQRAEARTDQQGARAIRQRPQWTDLCAVGAGLQAEHGRHARSTEPSRDRRAAACRCQGCGA